METHSGCGVRLWGEELRDKEGENEKTGQGREEQNSAHCFAYEILLYPSCMLDNISHPQCATCARKSGVKIVNMAREQLTSVLHWAFEELCVLTTAWSHTGTRGYVLLRCITENNPSSQTCVS